MGMFDSVYVTCRNCKEPVELQSKAGDCRLIDYHLGLDDIPDVIQADIVGVHTCGHCQDTFELRPKVKFELEVIPSHPPYAMR